jgi:RimJ/RimL family protein N-acetyltransferase
VLHRDHWGRGFIPEAAKALADCAVRRMGVKRLFACCDSENVASYRTMLKLGMRLCKDDGVRQNRSMGDEKRVEWTCEMFL